MRALLVVDVQNDFMPWGALPVRHGDEVVAVANALMPTFGFVVATQDWHPADHGSFASNHDGASPGDMIDLGGVEQVLWSDHCVQNSPGASFHSALNVDRINRVVRKGSDPRIDSYSGFFDNARRKDTGLAAILREAGAQELVIVGLATDYCVRATTLDALSLGFSATLVVDGVRAVDLEPGDGEAAIEAMVAGGAKTESSSRLLCG